MSIACIALGSNLGDRAATLHAALAAINALPDIRVTRVSSFHETAPIGGPPDQRQYLNAAAQIATSLNPWQLLQALLLIERQFGRERLEKDAPRTLDLDVLLYDEIVENDSDPIIPHPRMHERAFVLAPLAEISPDYVHPKLVKTVRELLAQLPAQPPHFRLDGVRAIVTGSTGGIGAAIALGIASIGADVIIHGRSRERGESISRQIAAMERKSAVYPADLGEPRECDRLFEAAWELWGGLDLWINNAGADTLTGEAATWPFERKLDDLLAIDVRATIQLSRSTGARMLAQGRGNIINMGWDQADTGMTGESGQLFGVAKSAVMAFTKSFAMMMAPIVRVNCLAPGWIKTAWGASASQEWQDRVHREVPLGRWGAPEDVAAAACWLASPAASFITGQVIRVNGGAVR